MLETLNASPFDRASAREHAKSWGAYAAFPAGTVSVFATGLNARCQ